MWIGTDGNGVLGLRNNGFVQVPVLRKLPKTIWNIFEDSNDHVWFATNKGAAKLYDETKLEFYNKNSGFTDDMVIEANKQLGGALTKDDVKWVLTVPAIWTDSAKHFMREAAIEV